METAQIKQINISRPLAIGHRSSYCEDAAKLSLWQTLLMTKSPELHLNGAEIDITITSDGEIVVNHDNIKESFDTFKDSHPEGILTLPPLIQLYDKYLTDKIMYLDLKSMENDEYELNYEAFMREVSVIGERAIICKINPVIAKKLIVTREALRLEGQKELPQIMLSMPDPVLQSIWGIKAKDEFMSWEEASQINDVLALRHVISQKEFDENRKNYSPDILLLCWVTNAFRDYISFGTFLGMRYKNAYSKYIEPSEAREIVNNGVDEKFVTAFPNIPFLRDMHKSRVYKFHKQAIEWGYKVFSGPSSSKREMQEYQEDGVSGWVVNNPTLPFLNPNSTQEDKERFLADQDNYFNRLANEALAQRKMLELDGFDFEMRSKTLTKPKSPKQNGFATRLRRVQESLQASMGLGMNFRR